MPALKMPGPAILAGAAGVAALIAAGFAAGANTERVLVNQAFRHDPDRNEGYGRLHGESRQVIAEDGVPLHVEVNEPRGFRPGVDLTIVFSHGFALNQDAWHYQRRDLGSLGRLVFWDQRSHGRSERAPDGTHTVEQLGRDLAAVVQQVAPRGPVILVGHSMGGMTVMSLAAQYPQWFGSKIVGVALISTSAGKMDRIALGLPQPAADVLHHHSTGAAQLMRQQKSLIEFGRSRTSDLNFLLTKAYSFGAWSSPSMTRFVSDMIAATPVDVVAEFLPNLRTHDKSAALDALQNVDVLVMVGDHDLVTPEEHSQEIIRRVDQGKLVVLPDSGHMVITERHPEVNFHLRELVYEVVGAEAVIERPAVRRRDPKARTGGRGARAVRPRRPRRAGPPRREGAGN